MLKFTFKPGSKTGFAISLAIIAALSSSSADARNDRSNESRFSTVKNRNLLAANKTIRYSEKEGFERKRKDIINTLQDNEVTRFATQLDALVQAFDLDKTLKNKGPYTVFAPSDKGWKRMQGDDQMALFANKKQLRKVLEYQIVEGNLDSEAIKKQKKLKTLEGHELTISERGGNLYADDVMIQTVDLPCTNGVIHVLDGVIMPPLSQ